MWGLEDKLYTTDPNNWTTIEMKDERGRLFIHPVGTCEDTFYVPYSQYISM